MIVPLEGDATIEGAGPVAGELVFSADDVQQMFSVLFADVRNTKIVHYQTKGYWSGVMLPQAGCSGHRSVAVGS